MVRRLTSEAEALALRDWFLTHMQGNKADLEPGQRRSRQKGFLIGPSQLCQGAGVNNSLGSRLFGDGATARPYVPFPEYLRRLTLALRDLLEERGQPQASEVTVIRAYLEAGYLERQDILDFLEGEGLEGWMREADCVGAGAMDLRQLDEHGQLIVREMFHFQLAKGEFPQVAEEVGK